MSEPEVMVDTTVLVEATLKWRENRRAAREALLRYSRTTMPTYAMKEFRAGALATAVRFHNLLVREKTLSGATKRALKDNSFARNRQSTSSELNSVLLADRFPRDETPQQSARTIRRYLYRMVMEAWRDRERLTTGRTVRLACFGEDDPVKPRDSEELILEPESCERRADCQLAMGFRRRREDVTVCWRSCGGRRRSRRMRGGRKR